MKFFTLILILVLVGCVHREVSAPSEMVSNESLEERSLQDIDHALAQAEFFKGLQKIKVFQKEHPQSVYFQASRLYEAEAEMGLGDFKRAADLYRGIYVETLSRQPDIAARALYGSSFAYEAMGDDLKVVAALLDAKKLSQHLPEEIAFAEIPARLAAVYGRQGRSKEAISYLKEADLGIEKARSQQSRQEAGGWLGRTYFQMGSVSTNQLSIESFEAFVQGQRWVQIYLLKAIKLNDPVWSLRAQNHLLDTYKSLDRVFLSAKGNVSLQTQLGGDFFNLIDQAELFQPLEGQAANKYEEAFFSYLRQLKQETEKVLFSNSETMSLTEESKRLNGIKRPGRIKEKDVAPLPGKVVSPEDPNL